MSATTARLPDSAREPRLQPKKQLSKVHLAQENERRRLSAELHDGVMQWMTGAFYRIKLCQNFIIKAKPGDVEVELTNIEKILKDSIKELRRIMTNLRPLPLEELGLVNALQQAVRALNEEGIRCHIKVAGKMPELTPAEEKATYRIVQEALANIRKHSGATRAGLRLHFSDDVISVEVRDNGQGFNQNENEITKSQTPLAHIGLISMKERAALLGGHLSIDSNPGRGTRISLTYPVSSQPSRKTRV